MSPLAMTTFFDQGDLEPPELDEITLIVSRSVCSTCCKITDEEMKDLPAPEELWWKNDIKTPDDCPICHKVLFHKGGPSPKRPMVIPMLPTAPMDDDDEQL